jgi:oxygen-independent coproporphyrinogen-3 oxidase
MININTIIDGAKVEITPELIERYDRPLPRYTSYPPAPVWTKEIGEHDLIYSLAHTRSDTLSLYIHLPFCRTRCTFCACNAIATQKAGIIESYIDRLIAEMDLIRCNMGTPLVQLSCLHWGGGTPTYLTEKQMGRLMRETLNRFSLATGAEVGIEADPRQTTTEKVRFARELGFNRISFGVQDTNPEVQRASGRIQDPEHIEALMGEAKSARFDSVNIDLCYGLPLQDEKLFQKTTQDVIKLNPDRISLFNFAYVPWMQPHQRKIDSAMLPNPNIKLSMFVSAIEDFCGAGYHFIGLDHFAKDEDEMWRARDTGALKRTFQGYTAKAFAGLVGIGVSSISEIGDLYVQNEKNLAAYSRAIKNGRLPACRGYRLSSDDLLRRFVMQKIFCDQRFSKNELTRLCKESQYRDFLADGLIRESEKDFVVTPLGRLFIRNIAAAFDGHLKLQDNKYSRTV